jgi:hypothetical protein
MVKKVRLAEVSKVTNNVKPNTKLKKKYPKTKDIPSDSFEYKSKIHEERLESEVSTLKFNYKKVEFHPADVEKMKTMSLEERNAYMIKLKLAGKYKVIEE